MRNWHVSVNLWFLMPSFHKCCTLPMRNWHSNNITQNFTIFEVVPYLWGIDTVARVYFLLAISVVPYLWGIDTPSHDSSNRSTAHVVPYLCGTAIDVIFPAYFGITHSFFSVVSYAQPFISNHSYSSNKLILIYWRLIVHFLSVIFVHFITVINRRKTDFKFTCWQKHQPMI